MLELWDTAETIHDLPTINSLVDDLEIANAILASNGIDVVCIGGGAIPGADLLIGGDDILLFDEKQQTLNIRDLESLHHSYWNHWLRE
ncbi:MAG TPA: hypothetical protein VHZ51_24750 [Ktedonobacteraceae bacterium]|nr:hypothetical protein [Ktedonobacteraceae bacterium]